MRGRKSTIDRWMMKNYFKKDEETIKKEEKSKIDKDDDLFDDELMYSLHIIMQHLFIHFNSSEKRGGPSIKKEEDDETITSEMPALDEIDKDTEDIDFETHVSDDEEIEPIEPGDEVFMQSL